MERTWKERKRNQEGKNKTKQWLSGKKHIVADTLEIKKNKKNKNLVQSSDENKKTHGGDNHYPTQFSCAPAVWVCDRHAQ